MVKVNGTTITMTRGDTFRCVVNILKADGSEYTPTEADRIVFTVKSDYADEEPKIVKEISPVTRLLQLDPNDTKPLEMPHDYVYDIQLTKEDGTVDTFINKAKLKITEEVTE